MAKAKIDLAALRDLCAEHDLQATLKLEAAKRFGVSVRAITGAIKVLKDLDVVAIEKRGRDRIITVTDYGKGWIPPMAERKSAEIIMIDENGKATYPYMPDLDRPTWEENYHLARFVGRGTMPYLVKGGWLKDAFEDGLIGFCSACMQDRRYDLWHWVRQNTDGLCLRHQEPVSLTTTTGYETGFRPPAKTEEELQAELEALLPAWRADESMTIPGYLMPTFCARVDKWHEERMALTTQSQYEKPPPKRSAFEEEFAGLGRHRFADEQFATH